MRYTASSGIEGSNPSRSGFLYTVWDIGAECKRRWIRPNAAFASQTQRRPNDGATRYDCGAGAHGGSVPPIWRNQLSLADGGGSGLGAWAMPAYIFLGV